VLIVGAGAAGITLARALRATNLTTLVLESGGLDPEADTQALAHGLSSRTEYPVDVTRLRYFGGTTNHWGGWCRALDSWTFDRRPWVADVGWPIGADELAPYYRRAAEVVELPFDPPCWTWDWRFWRKQLPAWGYPSSPTPTWRPAPCSASARRRASGRSTAPSSATRAMSPSSCTRTRSSSTPTTPRRASPTCRSRRSTGTDSSRRDAPSFSPSAGWRCRASCCSPTRRGRRAWGTTTISSAATSWTTSRGRSARSRYATRRARTWAACSPRRGRWSPSPRRPCASCP